MSKQAQIAKVFRRHRRTWISMLKLHAIDMAGYRQRVSECRQQLGMKIEHRERDGQSLYRYVGLAK